MPITTKEIILGTSRLSRTSIAEFKKFIYQSIELGIQEIDVAPLYGLTLMEKRLGFFCRGHDIRINTKFGLYHAAKPASNLMEARVKYAALRIRRKQIVRNFTSKYVLENFEQSLNRLKVEKINIFFAHDIFPTEFDSNELEDLFGLLKQKNFINFSGISTHLEYFKQEDFSRFSFIDKFQIYHSDLTNLPLGNYQIYSIHSLFQPRVRMEMFWINFENALENSRISKILVGTSNIRHLQEIMRRAGHV